MVKATDSDVIVMPVTVVRTYIDSIKRVQDLHAIRITDHPKHAYINDELWQQTSWSEDRTCEWVECITCMKELAHWQSDDPDHVCNDECTRLESKCQCQNSVEGCTGWYHEDCGECYDGDERQNSISENYGYVSLQYPCKTIRALGLVSIDE